MNENATHEKGLLLNHMVVTFVMADSKPHTKNRKSVGTKRITHNKPPLTGLIVVRVLS